MKVTFEVNGEEITLDSEAKMLKPESEFVMKREETIKALGFSDDSPGAQMIIDMTNAFFAAGMDRGATIANLMGTGKMTKEEFVKFMNEK